MTHIMNELEDLDNSQRHDNEDERRSRLERNLQILEELREEGGRNFEARGYEIEELYAELNIG